MTKLLKTIFGHLLLLLTHMFHKNLCFDFFQMGKNATEGGIADSGQHDCIPGMSVLKPPPCFAGDVKLSVVVNEGENAELRCFVYNVDFSKTLVSWWKERDLQETSLGLTTKDTRFQLPRRFAEDWTLVIRNAQPKDTGRYSCQINSESVLEKMFSFKVIEKPEKRAAVDRSYWLVKDEAYNSRKAEAQRPVHTHPEINLNPHLIRSDPFITLESSYQPLNDEHHNRQTFLTPTSSGTRLSTIVIDLLTLPNPIAFGVLIICQTLLYV